MAQHDQTDRAFIHRLETGVPGLDETMGGGLPEYSFNLIAGNPGTGKTTLALQTVFAPASTGRPALYFTVMGEPALKMLRYQQQFTFFDTAQVGAGIRFIDLSREALDGDLDTLLTAIVREVEQADPSLVVVDSFRTVIRAAGAGGRMELAAFAQRLALHLTAWQATTFLVGEYPESEFDDNPVFTLADGILWLSQGVERNSMVRKLQVVKMRGSRHSTELRTYEISDTGVQVGEALTGYSGILTGMAHRDPQPAGGFPPPGKTGDSGV